MLYLFPKQWKHSAIRTLTRTWFIPPCLSGPWLSRYFYHRLNLFSTRDGIRSRTGRSALCSVSSREASDTTLTMRQNTSEPTQRGQKERWVERGQQQNKIQPPCLSQRLSYPSKWLAGRIISIKRGYSPYKLSHNRPLYPKTTNS